MNDRLDVTPGPHRWQKGEITNPRGRPVGSRHRLSKQLIADLAATWDRFGAGIMENMAKEDPSSLAKLAFGILPKEALLKIEAPPPGNLSPDEWQALRGVLDAIAAAKVGDVEPADIFSFLEHCLR